MMRWLKKGLIYTPSLKNDWRNNSALTPTPILINENVLRVYAGFRDKDGVSRIGYVDIEAENPSKVVKISERPVLDTGEAGAFDDNGVILGDVIRHNGRMYMYYVGFQLVMKVKFLAFTGLAISEDGGGTFRRLMRSPVLDRTDTALYFRAVHSVMIENQTWKFWCGVGSSWETIGSTPYPRYNVRYYESVNGIDFMKDETVCINFEGNEYRLGRPRVYKHGDIYTMFYTKGTLSGEYIMGYAESADGRTWVRKDEEMGLSPSDEGWDSKSLCYGSLLKAGDKTYMFYNGNDYGASGFGYAELAER
jgi:predicted GH43/DUF377 family glycosyl hydrolase